MNAQSPYIAVAFWIFFSSLIHPERNTATAISISTERTTRTLYRPKPNNYNENGDNRRKLDDVNPNFLRCDESKCQSSGVEAIVNRTEQTGAGTSAIFGPLSSNSSYNLNRFDCYYRPQDNEAMLCAEGYIGVPINAEPPRIFTSPNFRPNIPIEQHYYTCCQATDASDTPVDSNFTTGSGDDVIGASDLRRQCSDPKKVLWEIDHTGNGTDSSSTMSFGQMPCDENATDGRIFPHPMTKSMPFYPDTYLCCDEVLDEDGLAAEEAAATAGNKISQNSSAVALVSSEADEVCDESRCISRAVGEFMPGFGCWGEGPGQLQPYACSDGYVGVPVNSQTDQPSFFDERQVLKYYTCCPPSFATTLDSSSENPKEVKEVRRHCSDPIVYQPGNETTELVCDDPQLKYPRKQNKNGHFMYMMRSQDVTTETYVCCDVDLRTGEQEQHMQPQNEEASRDTQNAVSSTSGAATSYFDEVNCVTSCDPHFFFDCIANNEYGFLWPMGCDDPNGVFIEPKVIGQGYLAGGSLFFYKYGCCKKGFGDGPFIKDRAFNQTVWPQLVLSAVSLFTSVFLVMALLLSFYYGDDRDGNSSMFLRSESSHGDRSSLRSMRSNRSLQAGNSNGAYNAYLVYLAIPDIILNLWVICMYGGYVNQKFSTTISSYIVNSIFYERKTAFDMAVILGCSAANLYLNSIISYQILTLLKNSRRRLRTVPPTFQRVIKQAVVVYALSICIALIRYFLADIESIPKWIEVTVYFVIAAGIPIVYLAHVCIVIWRHKLLPSLKGPLRILSLYFFRIIAVFVTLWLPGVLLLSLACNWEWDDNVAGGADSNGVLYPVGLYFCSMQPILSTGVALTKPDVRAAVLRLLNLSYFRRKKECNADESNLQMVPWGKKELRDKESEENTESNPVTISSNEASSSFFAPK